MIQNCPPDKIFWAYDGRTIKNLKELEHALHYMKPDAFKHHVKTDKNDFANWIDHVLHEETLAKLVSTAKTKDNMRRLVKKRIEEIEHPVKKVDKKMKKKTVKVKTAKKTSSKAAKKKKVKKRVVTKTIKKAKKPIAVLDEAFKSIVEPAHHHISLAAHVALGIVVGSALTLLVLMIL